VPIGVAVGLAMGLLTCLATELYCHRALAHRAIRVHPVLARILDGFMQVTGGVHPETWAGVHRLHHRYADTPLDPHSPLQRRPLSVLLGTPYLFALARKRLPAGSAPGTGRVHLVLRGLLVAFWLLAIGPAPTLAAIAVHLASYLGIMGMVNTVGHRRGRRPHPEFPGYDLAWVSLLLLGHGYHNSHHAHPGAARTGFLDPIWPVVRALSAVGLVTVEETRRQRRAPACCVASAFPAVSR
jgi:stearoyl-CoA desaturase (delta-9 desaturase)